MASMNNLIGGLAVAGRCQLLYLMESGEDVVLVDVPPVGTNQHCVIKLTV